MRTVTLGVLIILLAGCATTSSTGQNWYANGKKWAVAANKAQGGARLVGPTPTQYCTTVLSSGNQQAVGIAMHAPPLSNATADSAWIAGCAAGTS